MDIDLAYITRAATWAASMYAGCDVDDLIQEGCYAWIVAVSTHARTGSRTPLAYYVRCAVRRRVMRVARSMRARHNRDVPYID